MGSSKLDTRLHLSNSRAAHRLSTLQVYLRAPSSDTFSRAVTHSSKCSSSSRSIVSKLSSSDRCKLFSNSSSSISQEL